MADQLQLVATTFPGLENVLAQEVRALGGTVTSVGTCVVQFDGDIAMMYRANLWLRTALRVLKVLGRFEARNEEQLYEGTQSVDWRKHLSVIQTFAVDAVVHSRRFRHSKYCALKVKDAIVDQFRSTTGHRPSVDAKNPKVRVHLHIAKTRCSVSLDSSGESLHRRGYRLEGQKAPLNEVLASGLIALSGWNRVKTFLDPMCGSGTLPIEAALTAMDIAPGSLGRRFGFQTWREYDQELWRKLLAEAREKRHPPANPIVGADIAPEAIATAKKNAAHCKLGDAVQWQVSPFDKLKPPRGPGVLIVNPPYGERLHAGSMDTFYRMMGNTIKHAYKGYAVWVFAAKSDALKHIGLRPTKRIDLLNGPIECKFQRFEVYQGSPPVSRPSVDAIMHAGKRKKGSWPGPRPGGGGKSRRRGR